MDRVIFKAVSELRNLQIHSRPAKDFGGPVKREPGFVEPVEYLGISKALGVNHFEVAALTELAKSNSNPIVADAYGKLLLAVKLTDDRAIEAIEVARDRQKVQREVTEVYESRLANYNRTRKKDVRRTEIRVENYRAAWRRLLRKVEYNILMESKGEYDFTQEDNILFEWLCEHKMVAFLRTGAKVKQEAYEIEDLDGLPITILMRRLDNR